ncbi:MAG: phosphoribosylanthranilate isomerase [Armatimonadetes bacterium]|nr:phosphoribosylanthranilate isomerase [Armatimonadota bacterium]
MTQIKICGLTNADDARAAVRLGADALGFIGVPGSPRYITPDAMRAATRGLPPFVTTVVVVRTPIDAVGYPASTLQYYDGDSAAALLKRVRVFRIQNAASLDELREYRHTPDAVLLDAFHETALGGAGVRFDWNLAVEAKHMMGDLPVILAGGLTPENVADAVRMVRPYAVDVSSGVESEPRRKDHDKLRRFIAAVRDADREISGDTGQE